MKCPHLCAFIRPSFQNFSTRFKTKKTTEARDCVYKNSDASVRTKLEYLIPDIPVQGGGGKTANRKFSLNFTLKVLPPNQANFANLPVLSKYQPKIVIRQKRQGANLKV